MARECPVCTFVPRQRVFSMTYRIPDGWPLPAEIIWYTCDRCGMLYGDGDMDQAMLDDYYLRFYGYGVNNPDNVLRLIDDATMIMSVMSRNSLADRRVLDFGGAGDNGESILVNKLTALGIAALSVGVNDPLPEWSAVIYASHVLEHIYDLPATMRKLTDTLAPDGVLIVDVPDAVGLLERWKMPILDFNTKHLNHFTLRNLFDLGHRYGLTAVEVKRYELEYAPCWQVHFKNYDVSLKSWGHIRENISNRLLALRAIAEPVNVWGLSDVAWHLLSQVDLDVLDYIDNDPAYRGQTYNGKPVLERPTNDAPIVVMSQGQRARLIANIRAAGVENRIIEI